MEQKKKKSIGIDIGTTSISAVVWDEGLHRQLASQTVPNDAAIEGLPWEHLQDAEFILEKVHILLKQFCAQWDDIGMIGLTGQMHGMLYLDQDGRALSPLITWEDERANQSIAPECFLDDSSAEPACAITYAQYLQQKTGYAMSTGYGLSTYFYDMINHKIPEGAVKIATIMDYVAMALCNVKNPVTHRSNAASFGMYDLQADAFDVEKIASVGMNPAFLPEVCRDECVIGTYENQIPVVVAIGDNQAGVYAMLENDADVLLNIGTSSQISCINSALFEEETLECRPFVNGKFISLYAGLCGGSSFAMLNEFLREVCHMAGTKITKSEMFALMMEAAWQTYDAYKTDTPGIKNQNAPQELLSVNTLFRGTRENPLLRGSISNITMHNFNPGGLILGFYKGVLEELFAAYQKMPAATFNGKIILSGNAFRNNALLRQMAEDMFERDIIWTNQKEEAARGAAMLAAKMHFLST